MTDMLRRHVAHAEAEAKKQLAALAFKRQEVVERQRRERAELQDRQEKRWAKETAERARRLSKGFRGIWDRLTGKYGRTAKQNEIEALESLRRDRAEKDALILRHLDERQIYHQRAAIVRQEHAREVEQLHREIADYMRDEKREMPDAREQFRRAARPRRRRDRSHDLDRDLEPG